MQTQATAAETKPDARADLGNLVAGKPHLVAVLQRHACTADSM